MKAKIIVIIVTAVICAGLLWVEYHFDLQRMNKARVKAMVEESK